MTEGRHPALPIYLEGLSEPRRWAREFGPVFQGPWIGERPGPREDETRRASLDIEGKPPVLCMECDEPAELDDCCDVLPLCKKHRKEN